MRAFKKDFPACVVSSLIAALVVLAYLIAPAPLGLAQRSTPTPIVDKERAGGPERVQLETGKYKLVYRNKAGQIIEEEVYEYAGSMLNIWRQIQETKVLKAYPDGSPAQAKSVTFDSERKFATGETNSAFPSKEEEIKYDRDGKPFEVITYTADEDGKINRFHREVTTFPTGSGPKGVTVDQDYIQATGTWRDSKFQPKRPDEKRPSSTKTSSTSLPGYTIKNDNSIAGLSVVNLSTPDGRIYLNIPSAMSAGATISGTVVEEPEGKTQKEQEEHRATLDKLTLRIGDQPVPINNGIFRITIPAKYNNEEPPALHCGFGNQSVATVPINVSETSLSLTQFTIPTGGQDGRPLVFKGPFDGIVSDGDYLSVGNQQMPFMAESSDGLRIVRLANPGNQNTAPVYGQTTIKLNESGQAFECPFRRLGLALSSNRPLNLLRGETATVFVKVLGLAGLNQDVPLDLVNTTPNIINLQGGEEQHRVIHTGDVQGDGTYLMERNVTGVQRGAFNITATVTWKETCDRGVNTPPKEIPDEETWFDTARTWFRRGRQLADDASDASSRGDGGAIDLANEALQQLSRSRADVRRAVEAGEISESTATSLEEFISRFETEARQVRDQPPRNVVVVSVPTPTPASRPSPTPTATVTVTEGRFEPSQGVWQDDDYFADKPGKRLTRTGPTSWNAELKMVVGRNTLLFGIRDDQRIRIRIWGTTNGTRLTPVKFRFTLIQGQTRRVIYEQERAENEILLDGPIGPVQPFEASLLASTGIPEKESFKIVRPGPYLIEGELVRSNGSPTGLKVTVQGEAIVTHAPKFHIVPVVLSDPISQSQELEHEANRIAASSYYMPDYLPVKSSSINSSADIAQDLRSLEPGLISTLWSKLPGTPDIMRVRKDSLVAAIGQRFGTEGSLTGGEKIAVLLSKKDFALTIDPGEAFAYAVSQKVFVIQPDTEHFTLAHEFIHTTPFSWSAQQMSDECGLNYHNDADFNYGNGVQIWEFNRSRKDRKHAVMGPAYYDKWITQCSYWHLLNYLVGSPDPDLLLVRGYLARRDQEVVGLFDKFYELKGDADLPAGQRSADEFVIVLRDRANRILAEYPFKLEWRNSDLKRDRTIIPFTYRVPAIPGTYRVELVGKTGVLDIKIISPHAPELKILTPVANTSMRPTANGLAVIWRAADLDGDPLSYSVFYSPDGGENWRLVAYEQSNTSTVVPIRGRPRAARVRVIATDGTRSTTDEVGFSFAR